MSTTPVGGKDLRDLKGTSRMPVVAIAQKQALPDAPRVKDGGTAARVAETATPTSGTADSAAKAIYEALKRFSPSDYAGWIWEYLRYRFGLKHAFLTYDGKQPADGIYRLEADGKIKIGVAGDWGTGTDEAHKIGALIGAFSPHYTIHLGDVYFVGDAAEVAENFLGKANPKRHFTPCQWPLGSKASFALNGNHEMFARGLGYFDHVLPAMGEMQNGAAQGQKASYFCLLNDTWCILGLDTGYNSIGKPILEHIWSPGASLPDQILTWIRAIAPNIEGRAIIIMTHHQVLSVYDECFTKQADQLFAILKRPVLWFWGHEHRLVIYEPFTSTTAPWQTITGRCIGHGGMPVDLPAATKKPGLLGNAEFVDERPYINDEGLHVGINGMVQMTIDGTTLHVEYVDIYHATNFEETFTAQGGMAVRGHRLNHDLVKPR